jgi:hypothetical protein
MQSTLGNISALFYDQTPYFKSDWSTAFLWPAPRPSSFSPSSSRLHYPRTSRYPCHSAGFLTTFSPDSCPMLLSEAPQRTQENSSINQERKIREPGSEKGEYSHHNESGSACQEANGRRWWLTVAARHESLSHGDRHRSRLFEMADTQIKDQSWLCWEKMHYFHLIRR